MSARTPKHLGPTRTTLGTLLADACKGYVEVSQSAPRSGLLNFAGAGSVSGGTSYKCRVGGPRRLSPVLAFVYHRSAQRERRFLNRLPCALNAPGRIAGVIGANCAQKRPTAFNGPLTAALVTGSDPVSDTLSGLSLNQLEVAV